jgi:aromatic-L-amino-acid decarboxylase
MTPEEFRKYGRELIDWIARYMERVEDYPVLSQVSPGEIRARLPAAPPAEGETFEAVLRDIDTVIMPGITHWQSPNFFGYFPSNNSAPSILGELLSAGLGVNGMLWSTSPACTELETHVMDWLVDMLALPAEFKSTATGGGVIQDTASSSSLCALLAARERATGGRSNTEGTSGGRLVAYTSGQAHSSIEKDVRVAGLGSDNLRLVDTDAAYAMRPDHLAQLIAADKAAGLVPTFACATVGTTSSTAIDPVREIGRICREHGVWLHVDAALAGTAAVCPELRFVNDGIEFADSYVFNPHKWMLTNLDCSAFYVRDRAALLSALSILPEYLRNETSEFGAVIDYRDWQIPLGRRFRALKLWFVIRSYGVARLQSMVREHVALAREFASWVEADRAFQLAAPVPLNLVCFRHEGGDEMNQRIMDRLNKSGRILLTHTRLDGRLTLRMCIGQAKTQREHVVRAWDLIREAAAAG